MLTPLKICNLWRKKRRDWFKVFQAYGRAEVDPEVLHATPLRFQLPAYANWRANAARDLQRFQSYARATLHFVRDVETDPINQD